MRNIILYPDNLHNVGDLLLLLQAKRGIEQSVTKSDFCFYAAVWGGKLLPEILLQLKEADIGVINAKDIFSQLGILRNAYVIIPGGQAVRDNITIKRLIFMMMVVAMGRMLNATFIALGCGVGSVDVKRKFFFRHIFRHFAFLGTRDQASYEKSLSLAKASICDLTEDLIHLSGPIQHILTEKQLSNPTIVIAVCDDIDEKRLIDDAQVVQLAKAGMLKYPDAEVVLLAHDVRPAMDVQALRRISVALQERSVKSSIICTSEIANVLQIYQWSVVVITNRMHSALLGIMADTATIVIADGAPKMSAIIEKYDIANTAVGDTYDCFGLSIIENAQARKNSIRRRLALASDEVKRNFSFRYS